MIKIVFVPSDTILGYSHVFLFHKIKNRWYIYNPMSNQNIMFRCVKARTMHSFLKNYEHYDYDDSSQNMFTYGSSLCLSCVSMVKLYIGLDNRFIFTSDHLRLHLMGYKITKLDKVVRSVESIKLYCKMFLKRFYKC